MRPSAVTSLSTVTSTGNASTLPPAWRSSLASRASVVALLAASISRAPCRAAMRAVASPIQLVAPVMTITWDVSGLRGVDMLPPGMKAQE